MVTHYITSAKFEQAAKSVAGALMSRGYCGSKATQMACLDLTTTASEVTCKRCLAKMDKNSIK